MEINRPKLPPIDGYVEVDVNGERVYKRVYTPFELEQLEKDNDRDNLLVDQEYRLVILELGVTI